MCGSILKNRHWLSWLRFIFLGAWLLSACSTPILLEPLKIFPVYTLYLPSELSNLKPLLFQCSQEIPGISLAIQEDQPYPAEMKPGYIFFSVLPEAIPSPIYHLGDDEITIIVHPSNPLSDLSATGLRSIWNGEINSWKQLPQEHCGNCEIRLLPDKPITLWGYPDGFPIQIQWSRAAGLAILASRIYIAPHPPAMKEAVSRDPAAIGFLPRRWIDSSIKPVKIQNQPSIHLPILAATSSEANGVEKDLLICLQDNLKPDKTP